MSSFNQISIRELPTWVKVLKQDPDANTKLGMLKELNLIDDLLTLQKSFSLLKRKKKLRDLLEARISKELGYETSNLNRR